MCKVLVLRAPGTNCDVETSYAFEQVGGTAQRFHINRLLEQPSLLDQFQILCFPGGFSFGDDIAAGRILANLIRHHLTEPLRKFREDGKLILGICNGFQILIKSGLLLDDDVRSGSGKSPATLTWNSSGMYTDRWVELEAEPNKCVFLKGIRSLYLPIAHAEGKFVIQDEPTFNALKNAGQIVLRYAPGKNPNGSQADIAGICDSTGRVFGLMPHPERHLDPLQHPHWTRTASQDRPRYGDGFALFKNAVEYFK